MEILKTLCTISVTLLLSLSASEMLGAEASKQQGAKESHFTLIDFSHRPYLPELTLSGFYGDKDSSYGGLDILYPIYQSTEHIVFVDVRGVLRESPVKEFNLGTGYRWLNDDASRLYGAYLFYDRKLSTNKNWFNQMTLGGELKAEKWWVGGNVYLPFGTTAYHVDRTYHGTLHPHEVDLFIIKHHNETTTEYALRGVDLEVGYSLPWIEDLSVYVGGYYFDHDKTEAVKGPKLGVIYDVASLVEKQLPFVSRLEFEASWQNDKPRGKIWYAGIRLSIPLGAEKGHPQLKGLEKAMTRFVRRDVDAVTNTSNQVSDPKVFLDSIDGESVKVQIVTLQTELNDATTAGSGIDIIGVNGTITVTGGLHANQGSETTAAVTLLKGQSITGGNITHIVKGNSHTTCVVDDCDTKPVNGLKLGGDNGDHGHLIRVYTEPNATVDKSIVQRIQDLVLTVPKSEGTDGGQKSAVISNTTGSVDNPGGKVSFGNVVIDNVNANGIIDFWTDTSQSGKITVVNSQLDVKNPVGATGVISLSSEAQNDLQIVSISGNKIAADSDVGTVYGIGATYLTGSVSGNTFGDIKTTSANGSAAGIYLANSLSGRISKNTFAAIKATGEGDGSDAFGIFAASVATGSEVSGNKFNGAITAVGNDARGVFVFGAMAGTIKDNTFAAITTEGDAAAGIFVYDDMAGTIKDNVFSEIKTTGTTDSASALGIYVYSMTAGEISINKFNGAITAVGNDAHGVYVGGAMAGTIKENTFTAITSTGNDAYGVYVFGTMSGIIKDNTFTAITSADKAYGIYQGGINTFASTNVTDNTFTVTVTDGSDAYGISLPRVNTKGNLLTTNTYTIKDSTGALLGDDKKVQIR